MFKAVAIFHMLFFGQPVDVVYDPQILASSIEPLDTEAKCLAFIGTDHALQIVKTFVVRHFDGRHSGHVIKQIEPACVLVTRGA